MKDQYCAKIGPSISLSPRNPVERICLLPLKAMLDVNIRDIGLNVSLGRLVGMLCRRELAAFPDLPAVLIEEKWDDGKHCGEPTDQRATTPDPHCVEHLVGKQRRCSATGGSGDRVGSHG